MHLYGTYIWSLDLASNKEVKWKNLKSCPVNPRGFASPINVFDSHLMIIGGMKFYYQRKTPIREPLNYVDLYDYKNDSFVKLNEINHPRAKCSSLFNKYTNNVIIFGGGSAYEADVQPISQQTMEIYDFHKNQWFSVPYLSNNKYFSYPTMWTIGSKCIFVSKVNHGYRSKYATVDIEWIDLRVCDKNGKNRSKWNVLVKDHKIEWNELEFCTLFRA